jgi:hypothetical protein
MSSSAKVKKVSLMDVDTLPSGYDPIKDQPYMNDRHRVFFYGKLVDMRNNAVEEISKTEKTIESLYDNNLSDEMDIASNYS